MSLGNAAMYHHDPELALSYYKEVPTAQSAWNQSQVRKRERNLHYVFQIYVKLSETCEGDMNKSLLEDALSAITKALRIVSEIDNDVSINITLLQ